MIRTTNDTQVLTIAGTGLLGLAAIFLWNDLGLAVEYAVLVGAVAATALAVLDRPTGARPVGLAALGFGALAGGVWFWMTKAPALVPGLAVTALGAAAALGGGRRAGRVPDERAVDLLSWFVAAVAGACASAAAYFQIFTVGAFADSVGRRLVLTLGWLATGVALLTFGRRREREGAAMAGWLFLALAVGKTLLYDTTHLGGTLRVAGLGAGGVVLLAAAALGRRRAEQR